MFPIDFVCKKRENTCRENFKNSKTFDPIKHYMKIATQTVWERIMYEKQEMQKAFHIVVDRSVLVTSSIRYRYIKLHTLRFGLFIVSPFPLGIKYGQNL